MQQFGQESVIRKPKFEIFLAIKLTWCTSFGSEMAWDSTGQEGVYGWSRYFGNNITAINALNSVIAYQPLIPHWGYNGNARRYWCEYFYDGGKVFNANLGIMYMEANYNVLSAKFITTAVDSMLFLWSQSMN